MLNQENQDKVDNLLRSSRDKIANNVKLSIELANNAKKLSEECFYTKGLAHSLIQLGKNYETTSNYGEAMKCALQAMELTKSLGDILGEAACLNILGGVYNFLGDYNKRLDCNLKCLALRKEAKDISAQLSSLNNVGDTYMSIGDYENALKKFKDCLSFPDLDNRIQAIVYYNIGEVYFLKKEYKLANDNINLGLKFALKDDYWQIIVAAYELQARILIYQDKNKSAITLLDKAKDIAVIKERKEDIYMLYRYYADAYGNLKEYEKAYSYLHKYNQLKEKLLNENNAQKLKKIEFDFQFKTIKTESEEAKEKNKLLTKAFSQIEIQRNEIEDKNKSITDSIKYAKRIQNTILPSAQKIEKTLSNAFVFFQPKDIVSGDFYWIDKINDEVIFSVIDCTGHGVPGAFVSLIAHNALDKIITENKICKPSDILNELDKMIISAFSTSEGTIQDGMDIGICSWNSKTNILQFSGAFQTLLHFDGENLNEIKGNRESIGKSLFDNKVAFVNHTLQLKKNDLVYLSSDGFVDQFGGKKGKKLKWKGFKNMLINIASQTITEQNKSIKTFFNAWKGNLEQLDDVCVIGVKF